MSNLALIITGQLRTFFTINDDLRNVLLRSKKYYKLIYVICILNSKENDDYIKLSSFFGELDIKVEIIDYTKYLDEYTRDSLNKINHPEYIKLKEANIVACKAINDPDGYSIRHTWVQYHQLKIGISALKKYIDNSGIDFSIICKTRFDSKYPQDFYPNIPISKDIIDIISFDKYNRLKIVDSMNKYNIKNIDELIKFNETMPLRESVHIPIEHYALSFGGRVCYNYEALSNIKSSTENILYSFNDYYYFSNTSTFMKLINLYDDSCLYSTKNINLLKHIFCPESQLIVYSLNSNIDIIMYSECFYDSMVYRSTNQLGGTSSASTTSSRD